MSTYYMHIGGVKIKSSSCVQCSHTGTDNRSRNVYCILGYVAYEICCVLAKVIIAHAKSYTLHYSGSCSVSKTLFVGVLHIPLVIVHTQEGVAYIPIVASLACTAYSIL